MKFGEFYFDRELEEIVPAMSTATQPDAQQPAAPTTTPAKGQMPTDPMKAAADAKAAQAKAAADKQEQIKGRPIQSQQQI